MKKIKNLAYSAVAAIAAAPVAVLAQFGASPAGTSYSDTANAANMTELTFAQIITNVMNWLIAILGIGAIVSFVIAGIMYITAGGDEAKTEKAKNIMTYAIIGVVVALIGFIAIRLVSGLVGSDGIDGIN